MAVTSVALAAASGQTLIERVHTTPTRRAANGCAFLINARLVGGGTQTTCITGLDGVPGPGVVMHSRGVMTFHLKKDYLPRNLYRLLEHEAPLAT